MPKLLTDALRARLIIAEADRRDGPPLCKFFTPDAQATWLIADMDMSGRMFGLCDLGLGEPELGYVMLDELERLRGALGLPVERDRHFEANGTLQDYADAARKARRIVHPLPTTPPTPPAASGAAPVSDEAAIFAKGLTEAIAANVSARRAARRPARTPSENDLFNQARRDLQAEAVARNLPVIAGDTAPGVQCGDLALIAWRLPNTVWTGGGIQLRHELAKVVRVHDGMAVDFEGLPGGVTPRQGSRAKRPSAAIYHVEILAAARFAPHKAGRLIATVGKAAGRDAILDALRPFVHAKPGKAPPAPLPAPQPVPAPLPWPDPAQPPQPWPGDTAAERRSAAARKAIANRDRFAAGRKAAATRAANLAARSGPPPFADWVSDKIGTRHWTVGPAKRHERGLFDRILSPDWLAALRDAYARAHGPTLAAFARPLLP